MRVALDHDRATILVGDSAELGRMLPPHSVDAIVGDPPAGIAFMGRAWDDDKGGRDAWIEWLARTIEPAFDALRPGGHGLFWALPRTSHWTAMALELAGFEIRDRVTHLFGSGFPKSLNVQKNLEEQENPRAAAWDGWGTALKPAAEDWWLVRKPLDGTVAANVLAHGTGAMNIDASRIGDAGGGTSCSNRDEHGRCQGHANAGQSTSGETFHGPDTSGGRWPAHVVFSHRDECDAARCAPDCAVAELDRQSGDRTGAHGRKGGKATRIGYKGQGEPDWLTTDVTASKGGASRFFYCAKPAKSETELGLDHLPIRTGGEMTDREDGSAGLSSPRAGAGRGGGRRNFHPTKKSVALMQYLIRLITPPNGIVLDPFAGSGTTGVAALGAGFRFVGVEQGGTGEEYVPILLGRIEHALRQLDARRE